MNEPNTEVQVDFIHLPVVNFASQQNRVSLIRTFSIRNNTESSLQNIRVELQIEPGFAKAAPLTIDLIAAGETHAVNDLQIELSTAFFARQTERIAGSFQLYLYDEGGVIFSGTYPVDVLAFDQWGGTKILPEMLASFITPNHPAITPVIKRASAILEKWTDNFSFNEYQSRTPDRVVKQMAAIYAAIAELEIVYCAAPASFEESGQRIRMTDAILAQRLGNCLDMSLLYASCLEAVGIFPLIVLINGHAFTGAWLIPATFPDSIIDDPSYLTKKSADKINEIMLIEATALNKGQVTDFDLARKTANDHLLDSANFLFALDVKRARFSRIRPLPQRIADGEGWTVSEEDLAEHAIADYIPDAITPHDLSGISNEIIVTKQLLWERKLLDLSLRNSLLSMRLTKNYLQLIPAELDKFEDLLAAGNAFSILPKPLELDNPPGDNKLCPTLKSTDPVLELIKSEMSQDRLHSYLPAQDLDGALRHIYRSSKHSLEENGANTLYIALGLLRWYETPKSERALYAPLLLIPIEIIRKSAAKGYIIRSNEEDGMMNITLLEMLRQNFGINIAGLNPLPVNENGLDVKMIFSIIRKSISEQRKWDVEEQALVGIFSFSKFIMWNDIHNNSHKLAENKIVSSLMNGQIEWEVQNDMVDAAVIDKELSPTDLVLPISADSSQLEAIYEAVHDKSFILHGPPGTGKSQTITNIIANALYKGKRVLFVAEKMAALSVVRKRLAAIGLEPFCLELHSNKAKKSAVLAQLKATIEVSKRATSSEYARQAERLHEFRTKQNDYIEALHRKYPFGFSMYDAVTHYLSIEEKQELKFPPQLMEFLVPDTVQVWQDAVDELMSVGQACGHPHKHPLTGIYIDKYGTSSKAETETLLNEAVDKLKVLKAKMPVLATLLGHSDGNPTKRQTDVGGKIMEVLLKTPELTATLMLHPNLKESMEEYREVARRGKIKDDLKSRIIADYIEEILTINAPQMLAALNRNQDKWLVPRFFGNRKIKQQLRIYASRSRMAVDEAKRILQWVVKYQAEEKFMAPYADKLHDTFGKYGRKDAEDWGVIEQIIDSAITLHALLADYCKEGIVTFRTMDGGALQGFVDALGDVSTMGKELYLALDIKEEALYDSSAQWIDNALSQLNVWLSNLDKLKDWYQWLLIEKKFAELQLSFVTKAYKEEGLETKALSDMFHKGLYQAMVAHIIAREDKLQLFKGKLFNDVIKKYKQLTKEFEELTCKELYATMAASIPSFTQEAALNSEPGILQRNIKNNGRGMSIRRLFDQIPHLLPRLSPCMLMSPISVAQYIDPEADKFDLVIFDEASQMPTNEGVGAIARGKNMVIVGDPKQLPPTNFFNVNIADEENIELEDLESILDDCLALSMPSKYLLWHYRSKHESLIAFSNSEYYGNKLLTFPSPDNIESKVKLVQLDGFYDKGKSRQNKAEAAAVVKEVERRLSDPVLRKRSIGIVTFSVVQQTLIEDLLSDLFVFHPDLEAVATECEEPLFIKNLENVQGDERDVILFSVGYGPDARGRVSMNFGPLNREGGERRLNVAVSRARYEMTIFSTLRPEQIDLNRTSSVGVTGLRRFLEYAARGQRQATHTHSVAGESKSIESIIAGKLAERGHTVHTNIGTSGYKVNIGIVDPENPTRYVLGILCDGENYRNTKTVRDREIVQSSVLRLLGWNIMRIWTMDWWENEEEVIASVERELKEIPVKYSAVEVVQPVITRELPEETEVIRPIVGQTYHQPYQVTDLVPVKNGNIDLFFNLYNQHKILAHIQKIIVAEAPICRPVLTRRLLKAWNIKRTGIKIDVLISTLIAQTTHFQTKSSGVLFFWQSAEQCMTYNQFRVNGKRTIDEIPAEEIAVAVRQVVEQQFSLPLKDVSRLVAQLFGVTRITANVESAITAGINMAASRQFIRLENDRAVTC